MTQLQLRKRPSRRKAEEPELAWPLRPDPPRTGAAMRSSTGSRPCWRTERKADGGPEASRVRRSPQVREDSPECLPGPQASCMEQKHWFCTFPIVDSYLTRFYRTAARAAAIDAGQKRASLGRFRTLY